jgi:hypothetical protein
MAIDELVQQFFWQRLGGCLALDIRRVPRDPNRRDGGPSKGQAPLAPLEEEAADPKHAVYRRLCQREGFE